MGCASSSPAAVAQWETDLCARWKPLTMRISWTRESFLDPRFAAYKAAEKSGNPDELEAAIAKLPPVSEMKELSVSAAGYASAGILDISVTNPAGETLMTLHGGWKVNMSRRAVGDWRCTPMDTTITASTGEQFTAVCKMSGKNQWSWTLGNYSSPSVSPGDWQTAPKKLVWTASDAGEALPGVNALPKKIITQKLDGRVRTWGGANGGCPKGEAAAEACADDLLSVASTADKKLDESTKHVTVREATLSMPSHLLHKYSPQELALLLAFETDFFWSLGYFGGKSFGMADAGNVLNIVDWDELGKSGLWAVSGYGIV